MNCPRPGVVQKRGARNNAALAVIGATLFPIFCVVACERFALAAECLVRGADVTLEDVTVRPADVEPFTISLHEVPVTASLPLRQGAEALIDVSGAIVFKGGMKGLRVRVTHSVSLARGMVALRRGAVLANVFVQKDAVVGSVLVSAAPHYIFEMISPVRVSCSLLTLDHSFSKDEDAGDEGLFDTPKIWWHPKASNPEPGCIYLHSHPADNAPALRYDTPIESPACIPLAQIEARGSWLRVRAGNDGNIVTGWIRRPLVEQVTSITLPHCEDWFEESSPVSGERLDKKPVLDTRAKVAAGTRVFARPARGEWATITADLEVRARYFAGDDWVQLLDIPGINLRPGALARVAYVRRQSVSWPTEAPVH